MERPAVWRVATEALGSEVLGVAVAAAAAAMVAVATCVVVAGVFCVVVCTVACTDCRAAAWGAKSACVGTCSCGWTEFSMVAAGGKR